MRRCLASGLLALSSIPLAAVAQGCGSGEPPIEDLCGWLADPNNCYRKFAEDVTDRCGSTTEAGAHGAFLVRDKLDICFLDGGGQAVFDPPLDVAKFPLTSVSFKRIGSDTLPCGSGTFTGTYNYSVSIEPYPPDGGAGTGGGGVGGGSVGGATVKGGTFSSAVMANRDVFDVGCPGGETHHFNQLQVDKCQTLAGLLPNAVLESSPGSINGTLGHVKLRVYYPPADNASPMVPVYYFDCDIPAPPPPCQDGVKDGPETDIDCGGGLPAADGGPGPGQCARCMMGQLCGQDTDCVSGMCTLQGGFKKCL